MSLCRRRPRGLDRRPCTDCRRPPFRFALYVAAAVLALGFVVVVASACLIPRPRARRPCRSSSPSVVP